jgi:iron complex outermembrane receptor protein
MLLRGKFVVGTGKLLATLAFLSAGEFLFAPCTLARQAEAQTIDFALERQDSLAEALLTFARITGEQIIFPYDVASTYPSRPLTGKLVPDDALLQLLEQTPLKAYRNREGTIVIRYDEERARKLRLEAQRQRGTKPLNLGADELVSSLADENMALQAALLEELVITGSQLERRELVTANPLAIVDSEMISATGTVNVENAINRFSQVIPGLTAHSNNPGNGTVTVDLRGLGPNRTLVLVNGRRYAPSDQDGIVDLNAIPVILLKQVEIVTGGTSAVYGSDAISGVVNFILRDDLEGFLFDGRYRTTNRGDADKVSWDMAYGDSFGRDRGNYYFHVGYLERESLLQGERNFSSYALSDYFIAPGSTNEEFGYGTFLAPREGGVPGLIRSGSSAIPGTHITGVRASGPYPGLSTFNSDGGTVQFNSLTDAYNYAPDNYLQVPQKRWMASFGAHYDVTGGAKVYLQSIYVHNRVDTELAPTPGFLDSVVVPVDHPFLAPEGRLALQGIDWYGTGTPMQARDGMGNLLFDGSGNPVQARQAVDFTYDGDGNITAVNALWNPDGTPVAVTGAPDPLTSGNLLFESDGRAIIPSLARRFVEIGPRRQENERNTLNVVFGSDIDISDRLRLSASYNYSRYTHDQIQINDVAARRLRNALDIVEIDGEYLCADEQARLEGCLPVNIFGEGNITPGAAEYIRADLASHTKYERHVAGFHLSGDIDTPFQDQVKVLIGADWRREDFRRDSDEELANDESLGFNQERNLSGDYEVTSLFGEIDFPLIRDATGRDLLRFSGAFRFSSFTTSGWASSYAAGLYWQPIEYLSFRGQYQRAVRSPSIGELYTDLFETHVMATDPCASQHYAGSSGIESLCEATGVPIGMTGEFGQSADQVRSIYGGNRDLKEEHSDSFSAGFVVKSGEGYNLQLTVDYYNITINDRIDIYAGGTANIIDLCYSQAPSGDYCSAIHRFSSGQIDYVEALLTNQGKATTSGIDAQLFYFIELDGGLMSENDTLDFFFQGSYVFDFSLLAAGGLRAYNCAGYFGDHCGDPHPRFRFTQMTTWDSGPMSVGLRWRYLSGVREGAILSGTAPEALAVASIPGEHYFDLSVKYQVGDNITLRGGVDNMFGNEPTPVGSSQQQANSFPNFYDVLGPYMYFGFEARF